MSVAMKMQAAEVNGTKTKSLRYGRVKCFIYIKKSRARKLSLLSSKVVSMGVLSDDFAAVDVREELCYHSRPKKQIRRVILARRSFQKSRGQKIIRTATCRLGSYYSGLVPVVGLEPTRILLHRILSPARLPVSPHRRK